MQIVCVIPAFNEESTIEKIIKLARNHSNQVLIIDDGSTDNTGEKSKKAGGKVITHLTRLGVGAALSTGLISALHMGADIIVTLDADGQHDPDEIPKLITPILEKKADLVIGSRMLTKNVQMPLYKKIGNKTLSWLTSIACNANITDSQSGFRAFSREVGNMIRYASSDYQWASEMIIQLSNKDIRIVDVPIKVVYFKKRMRGVGIRDAVKILYNILSPK